MENLVSQMKVTFASLFSLYLKSHNYHWNVIGPHFFQYHDAFGDIYQEVHASIDPFAEQIRILGAFTPGSLSRFSDLTTVEDETAIPEPIEMFKRLQMANMNVKEAMTVARNMAADLEQHGLVSFLEARLEYHDKLNWMLKSTVSAT